MSLKNKYDYVVIRNEQPLGLSRNAFEYLLSLEKKIDVLKNSQYCPYDKKCGQLYECTKQEYEDMCNANMKLSLENDDLRYRLENAIADCQLRLKEARKQKEVIDRILNETKATRNILNNNQNNNMLSKNCLLSYLEIVEDILTEVMKRIKK